RCCLCRVLQRIDGYSRSRREEAAGGAEISEDNSILVHTWGCIEEERGGYLIREGPEQTLFCHINGSHSYPVRSKNAVPLGNHTRPVLTGNLHTTGSQKDAGNNQDKDNRLHQRPF